MRHCPRRPFPIVLLVNVLLAERRQGKAEHGSAAKTIRVQRLGANGPHNAALLIKRQGAEVARVGEGEQRRAIGGGQFLQRSGAGHPQGVGKGRIGRGGASCAQSGDGGSATPRDPQQPGMHGGKEKTHGATGEASGVT